jgi:ABC-type Mn2+/Zn2+ transport system ATPase subunit
MTPAVSPIEIIDLKPIRPSHSGVDVSVTNIAFAKGRRTAVIGPNGCGKTTLLEAALGLRPDYYRHVQIFGNHVKGADRFGYSDIGFAGQRHTYSAQIKRGIRDN